MQISSKKQLEIELSKLKPFEKPKAKHEQYITPSDIASDILWHAFMQGDIKDKIITDLGCGTGILGIGCLLLGAKKVIFLDLDNDALRILKQNLEKYDFNDISYEIIEAKVNEFNQTVDLIIQNPPFGTKQEHADKIFLEKAMENSNKVYSFHKLSTEKFVDAIAPDFNFKITGLFKFNYSLKKTQKFHTKKVKTIEVGCWVLEKN